MRPEELLARRLAREIEAELASLGDLAKEMAEAPSSDDTFARRARASILHDLYTGAERMFVRIAEELNGGVPRGEHWHKQLLDDMALDVPGVRPQVISSELAGALGQYLRFRHVFRNTYGFVLDATRMKPLEHQFDQVLDQLTAAVHAFTDWLLGEA